MPLESFGSILGFAASLEKDDVDFYQTAAQKEEAGEHKALFETLAKDAAKHIKLIERTRRENVTEMILEPIRDFTRDAFCESFEKTEIMSGPVLIETARCREGRAQRYYAEAAAKIKALPEVSRALKRMGKKRQAHMDALADL